METGAAEDAHQAPRVTLDSRAAPAQRLAAVVNGGPQLPGRTRAKDMPGAPRPSVGVEDGRTVMRVGGVIQSVLVDERYTSDGEIAINLWRSAYLDDQLRRIRRELRIHELAMVDDNIIVHCAATR